VRDEKMVQVVLFFLGGEHVYIYMCVQLHASIAGKQATYIYIFTSQLHASIAGEQDIYIYIYLYI
jgi:hypothetical protein